jgi:hypothetical protein
VNLFVKISGSLCSCLLPESLQVSTVKQLPEYHYCSGEQFFLNLSSLCFCVYSIYNSVVPLAIDIFELFFFFFFFWLLLLSEDCTECLSTTTACESTEIVGDHEKSLLSPMAVSGDVAFVKEVQK